jgi:hypothetical protein
VNEDLIGPEGFISKSAHSHDCHQETSFLSTGSFLLGWWPVSSRVSNPGEVA